MPPPRTSPDDHPAQHTVRIEEARLRLLTHQEEAVLIDRITGTVIWRKAGGATGVGFTAQEVAQMTGNILTHNHPGGWRFSPEDPRRSGNSFSWDDVDLFVRARLVELRAISPGYLHVIRLPDLRPDTPETSYFRHVVAGFSQDQIKQEFASYEVLARAELAARIRDRHDTFAVNDALAAHYHVILQMLAQDWGIEYERKEWRP